MSKLHELAQKYRALTQELGRTPTLTEFTTSGVSDYSIRKVGGIRAIQAAIGDGSALIELPPLPPTKPFKILFCDIETSLMLLRAFGIGEQYISINQIEKDWKILSFAAKYFGEDVMHYLDLRHEKELDDSMLLVAIHYLLSQTSVVVGHNFAAFDMKKINARFLKHNMEPIPDIKIQDTLKIARKHFKITSNKLEFLADYLECSPKSKHKKFYGTDLWVQCQNHNPEAWQEIEEYNKQDVITLIEVWEKLRKWDTSKIGILVNAVVDR